MAGLGFQLSGEFLGTFLFVLSILISGGNAIVMGATMAIIVFLIGGISGAYINPAVSLAMVYSGSLDWKTFFMYVILQLFGAYSAVSIYQLM
jgi:glycerol uptake facilitator-like aquaporin